ncbi:MAG: hypothetical protein HGA65_09110, partial [Oscillochloris sp.]|nr:hypothetical protein [Oscillochloris sp.]
LDRPLLVLHRIVIQLPFTAIRVPTTFEYTPIEILGGPNKTLVEGVIALGEHGAFHIGTQQLMLG